MVVGARLRSMHCRASTHASGARARACALLACLLLVLFRLTVFARPYVLYNCCEGKPRQQHALDITCLCPRKKLAGGYGPRTSDALVRFSSHFAFCIRVVGDRRHWLCIRFAAPPFPHWTTKTLQNQSFFNISTRQATNNLTIPVVFQ